MAEDLKGVCVIATDVSDKHRAERAVALAQERARLIGELQNALKKRDEFISIASHELRTPLAAMKMHVQMMKRRVAKKNAEEVSAETVVRFIDHMDRQIDRLVRLIEDMLSLSRLASEKLPLNLETVDLCELAHEVIDHMKHLFDADKISIFEECQAHVQGIWDRFRIEQVISNLLLNALRYGRHKPVSVSIGLDGDDAVLKVQDQGIGIPEADQHRIFERFERAVSPNESTGLGLGLYISREILKMHGGSISVTSELAKGSTFIVKLPRHAKLARMSHAASAQEPGP